MSNKNYELGENRPDKINASLLYITEAVYGQDWHSMEHSHHFSELFYITRGCGNFLFSGKSVPVKKNDLIIVNPNVTHTEKGDSDFPMGYIVLGINGLQFQTDNGNGNQDYAVLHMDKNQEEIYTLLKMILCEVRKKEDNFEGICQNLVEILLWQIMRKTKADIYVTPAKKITKECRFIEQYLDEHFTEDISLQALSDLTYLNKYYLVHAFTKYKGTSPINYLIEKRIEKAKHLLSTTSYPVTKVAELSGFSSQSYFSQAFRKETSMTPNQYRKKTLE